MKNNPPSVLIIEDNIDIADIVNTMLEMNGYTVFLKTDAIDLENSIRDLSPDLIIMDMLLSWADGREICKALKANPESATIPIFMMSAHPNAKEECLKVGANYFLEKPFDMHDFLITVEKSIALRNTNL